MFWSNWVKGVCSIVVFAGLIIAIDLANSFGLLETDQGIVIIIGIVLVLITYVSFRMMIYEISKNINEINNKLSEIANIYIKEITKKSETDIKPQINATPNSNSINTNQLQTWNCEYCGARNSQKDSTCKQCGKTRFSDNSVQNKQNSNAKTTSDWICPECNNENTAKSRFCIVCGHQK